MAVLWNRKDLSRFTVPTVEKFWSGSGSVYGSSQYLFSGFPKTKEFHKILLFQCQKQLNSQKIGLRTPLRQKVTVLAVPVPAKMHSGSGSAKAKSYGSCGSGFGFTTLLMGCFWVPVGCSLVQHEHEMTKDFA
jgi:hypothetical protein